MTTKVLVLGSNFGGLTSALALKSELGPDVDVTVVSPSDRFVFTPSLIWVPFGKRSLADISFSVDRTLDAHGVHFVHEAAKEIDADARRVVTDAGSFFDYDYLVLATGYRNDMRTVRGIGVPGGSSSTITTVPDAFAATPMGDGARTAAGSRAGNGQPAPGVRPNPAVGSSWPRCR